MVDLDVAIRVAYEAMAVPVDTLLSNGALEEEFLMRVREQLPSTLMVDDDEIKRRLLALRKKGADRGGLPRLQRAYRGRFGRSTGADGSATSGRGI